MPEERVLGRLEFSACLNLQRRGGRWINAIPNRPNWEVARLRRVE